MWNETTEIDMLWSAEDDLVRRPDEWRGLIFVDFDHERG
jgi:hypothetical protein